MISESIDRRFCCTFEGCNKSFNRIGKLQRHIPTHTGEVPPLQRPFSCTFEGCGKTFKRKDHLCDHVIQSHSQEPPSFPCTIEGCQEVFNSKKQLTRHLRIHENPYSCPEVGCNQKFTKKFQLLHHLSQHNGQQPYRCPHFIDNPNDKEGLQKESKDNSPTMIEYEEIIEQLDFSPEEPQDISITSISLAPCLTTFHSNPDSEGEENLTERSPSNASPVEQKGIRCPMAFQYPSQLKRHIDSVHLNRPHFYCGYSGCSQGFVYMRDLKRHVNQCHRVDRKHKAAARFISSADFESQSPTLTPISSPKAPKSRPSIVSLLPGIPARSESFTCHECGKNFRSKANLSNHCIKIHDFRLPKTDPTCFCEFPVDGGICAKSFSDLSNLKKHVAVSHLKEKLFLCLYPTCGKSFGHKSVLQKHYKRVHEIDPPAIIAPLSPSRDFSSLNLSLDFASFVPGSGSFQSQIDQPEDGISPIAIGSKRGTPESICVSFPDQKLQKLL